MLNLRLDIQKLGSVPDYLLDHLQISKSPDERFTERIQVRSFRDEAGSIHEKNILWMPESSIHGYRGMPRVQPRSSGTHYYQASIILQDQEGKEIYSRAHPASTAYLTIHTGIEANALKLWINMNPFAPQTKNAELLKAALSFKYGSLVSILDAFDAINRGDTDALFRLLFDEIKGAILDKAGSRSAHTKEAIETYTQLAMAEKVLVEIAQDQTGPIAAIDDGIYQQLTKVFQSQPGQLVILQGNGNQSLRIIEAPEAPARDDAIEVGKGKRFGITISGVDKKTVNTVHQIRNAARAGGSEIPTKERSFEYNSRLNTYAWKNGGLSIYLVPPGAQLQEENTGSMRRY